MPILDDVYATTEITLPVSGAKAQVTAIMSTEEEIRLSEAKNDTERSFIMVVEALRDWDLTDKEGNKLPINEETVRRLPNEDGANIIHWVSKQINKRRKAQVTEEQPAAAVEPEQPTPSEDLSE